MAAPHTLELALISAGVLGFRHGFDYDHIAAISDITSVEPRRPVAMRMGVTYVLGHAATVAVLGGAVILFQRSLPAKLDTWAERAVGFTLILLSIYVLGSLIANGKNFRPKSRAKILIGAATWAFGGLRRVFGHAHDVGHHHKPLSDGEEYSARSVFSIGVIHGLGAETPTQLLLFLLAANLGGVERGLLGLGVFLAGLIVMNTLMTASAVGIFGMSAAKPHWMRLVVGFTAAYSFIVGAIFLFGSASSLPSIN
jgi:hypothetical protein